MVILPEKFCLAPMAEISTPALRRVVTKFYPGTILYSEMISAGAIRNGSGHNTVISSRFEFDENFIYQIAGSKPEVMADAARILSDRGCYSIDINMGCSAPDIVKTRAGAKLLTDRKLALDIVRQCRKAVGCCLSVKMRSGYENNDEKELIEFVRMLEDEGVDFITLHPRFAKLAFRRKPDWRLVSSVKNAVKIPVIGNGDITSAERAVSMLGETGCDGIMIGREAVKSPWIFSLCSSIMEGKIINLEIDIHSVFIEVLDLIMEYLPEHLHESRGHRFCFYYSKNAVYSHDLFRKIRNVKTIDEMKTIVNDYYSRNPDERTRVYSPS